MFHAEPQSQPPTLAALSLCRVLPQGYREGNAQAGVQRSRGLGQWTPSAAVRCRSRRPSGGAAAFEPSLVGVHTYVQAPRMDRQPKSASASSVVGVHTDVRRRRKVHTQSLQRAYTRPRAHGCACPKDGCPTSPARGTVLLLRTCTCEHNVVTVVASRGVVCRKLSHGLCQCANVDKCCRAMFRSACGNSRLLPCGIIPAGEACEIADVTLELVYT